MLTTSRRGITMSEVSPAVRQLIRLNQSINFGRIMFYIRDGEPDFLQPWRTVHTVKLDGGSNGPRPEAECVDFELCKEQTALLAQLAALSDGTRVAVDVKKGLPFLMEIEQDHRAP